MSPISAQRRASGSARPAALLLGGGETALPVARSLARAGIQVRAAGLPGDVISRSRYCSRFTSLPEDAEAQLTWLRERSAGEVLLPCSDDTLEVVARAHAELTDLGYILPDGSPAAVLAMLDKDQSYQIAQRAGIPVPAWQTIRGGEDFPQELAPGDRRCVVKPAQRHHFQRVTGSREKVIFASSRKQLEAKARALVEAGVDVMVTEVVPGPDSALWSYQTYADADGTPLFDLTLRKLRQEPPGFGIAALAVGEWNPEVAALGRRFVLAAGLRGPIEIEFKRDDARGEFKLIECNHRLNLLLELVRRSGFDLALLTYARAVGCPPPALGPARWGYRLWHPLMDLRLIRQHEGKANLVETLTSVIRPRVCFTVWATDDPLPGLDAAGKTAHAALRKLCRRHPTPLTGD